VKLIIDYVDGTDENITQLMSVIQYGLSTAVEAELVHPDLETDLRNWMRVERQRLRAEHVKDPQRDTLRDSKWFEFWSTLLSDQEVRWTQTKSATYFVVTGDLVTEAPDRGRSYSGGPFVELRRHTGKTFWSHIAQVRPLGWVKEERKR
jgi:hypothetical protein